MTSDLTDLARQYRARAEECRERASAAVTEERRQSLLQIAETWERMAKWEAQPHPQRTSGKSLKPAKSPKPHARSVRAGRARRQAQVAPLTARCV